MKGLGTGGVRADLSEEGDWLLTHSVCIPDVSLDDLSKRLFHSLQSKTQTYFWAKLCFIDIMSSHLLSESEQKSSLK